MSPDLPLHYWSVTRLQAAYASGGVSPAEATQACTERIARLNGDLHAFILTLDDEATAHAAAIDSAGTSGAGSPLAGVPYALKDNFDVAGLPTTCHSRSRLGRAAPLDSEAHAALKRAGAVLLGKNSMHELATGGPSFDLPWPPARNPWNRDLHPGGSSSGSGVAVAAGMSYFALGTDTGGSVRHPATACGIFGFKPSFNAISTQGVVPLSRSLDHPGVLARACRDIATIMAELASTQAERKGYAKLGQQGPTRRLREFSIGVIDAFSTDLEADPDMAAAFEDMLVRLGRAGCRVVRIRVDPLACYVATARNLIAAEAYSDHGAGIEARPEDFSARTRVRIGQGKAFSREAYAALRDAQRRLASQLQAALDEVDVAMALSSLHFPCNISDERAVNATYDKQARTPFNLTGMPAIAVPTGVNKASLPLGLQFAAGSGRDVSLLEFSMALEAVGLSGFMAPPEVC